MPHISNECLALMDGEQCPCSVLNVQMTNGKVSSWCKEYAYTTSHHLHRKHISVEVML